MSVLRRAALILSAGLLAGCSTAESGHGSAAARLPPPPRTSAAAQPTTPAVVTSPAPVAKPVRTPCTGNHRRQWVFVSLKRQHTWMCARNRVVRDTPITSGMLGQYTETPAGHYVIQGRNRNTSLTLLSGEAYAVKYWIPFDAPLFGFHDSSWQDFPYGSPEYRTRGSHGCVHVPLKAIRFLYRWAEIGTPVTIRG